MGALAKGEWAQAWSLHPLSFGAALFVIWMAMGWARQLAGGRAPFVTFRLMRYSFFLFLAFGLLRIASHTL